MEQKKKIVEEISAVMNTSAPFEEIVPQIRQLKGDFVNFTRAVKEAEEKTFMEHGSPDLKLPSSHDEWDTKFSELMTKFNQLRKSWEENKAVELGQNLEVKKQVIADLQKLIVEEQHIGHAFEKFHELKEIWKQTGDVPASDYRELQQSYSHLIEEFFYNINIYKTLKAYDLQKNLQLKTALIAQVKALLTNQSVKEVRELIAVYVKEWDEIGPTNQEHWEKVRDEFWESCRQVYKIIGDHFKEQKDQQKANLTEKENCCESMENITTQPEMADKQWKAALNEVRKIQEDWKKIGFAGKKKNDLVWKRFKVAVDVFYALRKEHREEMKDVYKANEEKKLGLIKRAEELRESVDWKNTAEIYKKLQSDWKRTGATHPSREQRLWKKFRGASDYFFAKRKEYFDGREDREKDNLIKKQTLLNRLKEFNVDPKDGLIKVQEIGKEWNSIGFVPADDKVKLEQAYQKMLAEKMSGLGLKGAEVEDHLFELKVDGFREATNGEELLRNEYKQWDEKLKKIEAHIQQYENNLGFFGKAADDNPLVIEVKQKINVSKEEASKIRTRMNLLKQ